MKNSARDLLVITRQLKGTQLDQFQSLIEGSEDVENDYNPNALRQIEESLAFLFEHGLMDEESYDEIMALSQRMVRLLE